MQYLLGLIVKRIIFRNAEYFGIFWSQDLMSVRGSWNLVEYSVVEFRFEMFDNFQLELPSYCRGTRDLSSG